MTAVLALIFLAFVALAAGFVVWPILARGEDRLRRRALLAAAAAVLVLGVGGGIYLMLGSPGLALRTLTGPTATDLPGLVATLAARVRAHPDDLTAWTLLGRGYLTLGDANDAAGAFRQAADLAPAKVKPGLLANYGEALTLANSGTVPDQADAAFSDALKLDPANVAARYYIGLSYAQKRQPKKALAMWQGLLDDAPPDAPYRAMLVDRIASLTATGVAAGTAQAPDIGAMVAQLAGRLKTQPNDPDGWQRLIRAYSVLGDRAKATAALADARTALKGNAQALASIEAEAKSLGVQK